MYFFFPFGLLINKTKREILNNMFLKSKFSKKNITTKIQKEKLSKLLLF